MDMIEKVARAICAARYGVNPDAPSSSYYAGDRRLRNLTMWEQAIPDARAALQAMLEPSEGMLDGAWKQAGESKEMRPRTHAHYSRYFTAMIRAALEEK